MEKEYRCAIIGQHPMRFPWGFDEEDTQCRRMKLELAQCIMELRQCGVTEFQVACDPGVGLYAGEIVNITKQNDEAMRLVCVTPFEEQATKWTPQLRERYFDMLADCTDLSCVDYQETPNAQLWPIGGSSSSLICWWPYMTLNLPAVAQRTRLWPMPLRWGSQPC